MRYHSRKRRSIPVRGQPPEPYEKERDFKCWNCGQINTTGMMPQDTGKSSRTTVLSDYTTKSNGIRDYAVKGRLASVLATEIGFEMYAREKGQDGSGKEPWHSYNVVRYGHCASCGATTWAG